MDHAETPEALLGVRSPGQVSIHFLPDLVAGGLPLRSLDTVVEHLAPRDTAFKFRLIPKATLVRRRKSASGKLTVEEGDKLVRLAKTFSFALQIYRDPDRTREFLARPHPMLGGKAPLEMAMATGAGADAVITLLGRMAYGGGV